MERITIYLDARYEPECFYIKRLLRTCPALRTRVRVKYYRADDAHVALCISRADVYSAMEELTSPCIRAELAAVLDRTCVSVFMPGARRPLMDLYADNWLVNMIVHEMYVQLQLRRDHAD